MRRPLIVKVLRGFRADGKRVPEDVLSPGETLYLTGLLAGGAIVALAAGLLLVLG